MSWIFCGEVCRCLSFVVIFIGYFFRCCLVMVVGMFFVVDVIVESVGLCEFVEFVVYYVFVDVYGDEFLFVVDGDCLINYFGNYG